MAGFKKDETPVFSQMHFDDYQFAKDVKETTERLKNRKTIGIICAAVATLIWVLLFFTPLRNASRIVTDGLGYFALGITVVAYAIGGGIVRGFGVVWNITKKIAFFGWFIMPFPYDLLTGLVTLMIGLMFALLGFIFVPLLPVFCSYYQSNQDYKEACAYLSYYVPDHPDPAAPMEG